MNFPSQTFFNINHGYSGKKLWLLLFFITVATYCYYEKVHRTMRTTIVLYLFNICTFKIKSNWKHFWSSRMAPKQAKLQIFIQVNLYFFQNIPAGKKTKTCQERPNLVCDYLIQVFYKMAMFPRRPLLSGPKSGCLIQMMSAFFYLQPTENRLFNNCVKLYWFMLILDKFFLKYDWGYHKDTMKDFCYCHMLL